MRSRTTGHQQVSASDRDRIIDALVELVDALDRRVPHVERVGENHIARDAAALRREAQQRIEELKAGTDGQDVRKREFSSDVMTDDGGPAATE